VEVLALPGVVLTPDGRRRRVSVMVLRMLRLACALALALQAPRAVAQACESARPTDAAGAAGLSYGSADVAYLDSASGLARVHYALSGVHAPPPASTLEPDVPDAIVVAAQAADDAFDKYAELGFQLPLTDADSPCASNGDSVAIDIYVVNFAGADGQAVHDHCKAGPPVRCAGFVLVENNFPGAYADTEEGMRTVVPHELFHLVQDGYDAEVERWWAEGSAQWAAKQVYPELQDLERFLPGYFDNPWRPLYVPPSGVITSFLYATAIWPVFLHERHDAALVREIYEGFTGDGASVLETTDLALQGRDSSLAQEFLQFAAYNAATGERAEAGAGYSAAADYPQVPLTPFTVAQGATLDEVASGLGAFYYSVQSSSPLELSLAAEPERVAALLVPVSSGQALVSEAKPLPATLEGEGIVVVAGQSLSRTDAPFTLRAGTAEPPQQEGDDDLGESGCSMAPRGLSTAPGLGALLGFVVSLLGLARRFRLRKDA
jgi:hypothetical protein